MQLKTIKLVKQYMAWPAGNVREVAARLADQLISSGMAVEVDPDRRVENKAVQSEPAKRGPGRPRKIAIDDKAIA